MDFFGLIMLLAAGWMLFDILKGRIRYLSSIFFIFAAYVCYNLFKHESSGNLLSTTTGINSTNSPISPIFWAYNMTYSNSTTAATSPIVSTMTDNVVITPTVTQTAQSSPSGLIALIIVAVILLGVILYLAVKKKGYKFVWKHPKNTKRKTKKISNEISKIKEISRNSGKFKGIKFYESQGNLRNS